METEIRLAGPGDAVQLLGLRCAVEEKSPFMVAAAGERVAPAGTDRSFRVIAVVEGELVGFVEVLVGRFGRVRHRGYVVMGILERWCGRGLGRRLLEETIGQAHDRGLQRLELTVRCDNSRAVALYERCGFVVEGRRRASMLVNGVEHDEGWV